MATILEGTILEGSVLAKPTILWNFNKYYTFKIETYCKARPLLKWQQACYPCSSCFRADHAGRWCSAHKAIKLKFLILRNTHFEKDFMTWEFPSSSEWNEQEQNGPVVFQASWANSPKYRAGRSRSWDRLPPPFFFSLLKTQNLSHCIW